MYPASLSNLHFFSHEGNLYSSSMISSKEQISSFKEMGIRKAIDLKMPGETSSL